MRKAVTLKETYVCASFILLKTLAGEVKLQLLSVTVIVGYCDQHLETKIGNCADFVRMFSAWVQRELLPYEEYSMR